MDTIITDFLNNSKSQDKNNFIEEYYKRGLSIIPLGTDKKPLIQWREYQNRTPEPDEIYKWFFDYPEFNIGVITGFNFYSLDIDNKEAFNLLPLELKDSMLTETQRGFHLNFTSSKTYASRTLKLNNISVEFKGAGSYVVEPYSVINGFEYKVINSISEIKSLPNLIEDLLLKRESELIKEPIKWTYKGKASCIKQILDRELKIGEREASFFILYNLLQREGNSKEYSKELIIRKNRSLINSLPEKELLILLNQRAYNSLGCAYARDSLPYISCKGCEYYREALKSVDFKKALDDSKLNRKDLKLIYEIYVEEETNKTELAKELGINRRNLYKKLESLKKKGYEL